MTVGDPGLGTDVGTTDSTVRDERCCIIRLLNYRFSSAEISYFLVANVFVSGTVAYATALESGYADFYYFSIQEDEYLEWSSFWAFLPAASLA